MELPRPTDKFADCIWLPRLLAKARLLAKGALPEEYVCRFCHPTGVDGHFLSFFSLNKEEVLRAAGMSDEEAQAWFLSWPGVSAARIAEWNHLAINLGRPGFPMGERLPVALRTSYRHLSHLEIHTVFEALDADEGHLTK